MKAIVRLLWAAAMATVTANGLVAAPSARMQGEITVCMQTQASIIDHGAQAIASQIFGGIGVRLEWQHTQRSCLDAPDAIIINLMNHTPRDYRPGALAFALPYEGVHIVVFYDRIVKSLGPRRGASLLAHVLAHEITHLLQGVSRHSETGVMKAYWELDDYERMAWQPLSFTAADVKLIRLGLEKRMSHRLTEGGPGKP
jgi:hypothetical protein